MYKITPYGLLLLWDVKKSICMVVSIAGNIPPRFSRNLNIQ